jgi:hypothetical protein
VGRDPGIQGPGPWSVLGTYCVLGIVLGTGIREWARDPVIGKVQSFGGTVTSS